MISQLRAILTGSASCLLAWTMAAQTPPPPLQVSVSPPDGSILITETTNSIFVAVGNFDAFTNVIAVGSFVTRQNFSFLDDGQPPDQTVNDGTFSADLIMPKVPVGVASNVTLRVIVSGEVPPPDPLPDPPPPPEIVAATNTVRYVVVPRPANDNFTNAFKIAAEGAVILATNNYASMEPGEPLHALVPTVAASVWWTWSPAVNTNVLIDLAGSSFDPVLAVYTGSTVTNLQPVAASTNDAVNGLKAHVNFDARAGVTYRIAVAGYDTNGVGNIRLRVAPGRLPDTNGPVTTIISPASESLFTTNAVTLTGTAKDPRLDDTGVRQVFLQVNTGQPVAVAGTTNWFGQLLLPPGTNTVRAFAQDIAGNVGPADIIVVRFINPTNDNFGDAIELTGLAGVVTAVNERATREPGEPLHAGNEGGHSIWYQLRAPVNGTLFLSTTNSDFDTLLAVYTGDSVTNLTLVANNDDAFPQGDFSQLTTAVVSNQLYYIAVDGYGGTYGNVRLQYIFTTIERYFSLTIDPPLGGSVSPPSGLYLANTILYLTAAPSRDFEFIGWSGAVNSADNPVTLIVNQNYTLTARFRLKNYTEGFESGGLAALAWSAGGNISWHVQSSLASGGRFSAQSGPIGDNQQSSLILITNLLSGVGSFDYRVSSEAGWDALEFYLNGTRLGRWSGEVDWNSLQFRVQPGLNTLEWRYTKDANFAAGRDAAFIDNVYLPLPDSAIAARLAIVPLPDGQNRIQVQGLSDRQYVIQASANLVNWNSVATNVSDSGTIQWTDPQPANQPRRFYRAIAP